MRCAQLIARTLVSVACVSVAVESTALAAAAPAENPKVATYYGTNAAAWFSRSCKIVAASGGSQPLVYLSIADAETDFIFWSFSPTFALNRELVDRLLISDNMHSVPGVANVMTNLARGRGGIAQAEVHLTPSGEITRAELQYFGAKGRRDVDCGKLVKR